MQATKVELALSFGKAAAVCHQKLEEFVEFNTM